LTKGDSNKSGASQAGSTHRHGLEEFRHGWTLVLSAMIGVGLGLSPVPFYEIGLIAPELAREFNWPIATIMGGVFFMMVGVLIMAPVIGWLTDRYGVRPVTMTSIVCFGLSLSLFALQNGSVVLYHSTWFLMAIAGSGTLPITWTRTVNESFEVNKGLALGLMLTGTGLSAVLLKPAVAMIMLEYGWRGAFLLLAALPVVIALPLTWLFFRPVAVVHNRPHQRVEVTGKTLVQALRDWHFWVIGLGILMVVFVVSGVIANLEVILKDRRVSSDLVLQTTPFLGFAIIAGRLLGGWLIDNFWAPAASFGILTLSASAVFTLGSGPLDYLPLLLTVIGIGLAAGVEFDLLSFLRARYFGLAHYGKIYGVMFVFFTLGAGSAPFVFGRVFDSARSFEGVLNLSAFLIMLGATAFLTLGRYHYAAPRN